MERFYQRQIKDQIDLYQKMSFISGPRQVGKTTIAKKLIENSSNSIYLNWDYPEDRLKILNNYNSIFESLLMTKSQAKHKIIFDEIHKFPDWKNLTKGFYDKFGEQVDIIVTGSAKLNIYKKGGDSLMGRYLNLTIHPLSTAEVLENFEQEDSNGIRPPKIADSTKIDRLLRFGGFAEPYIKASDKFHNIWSKQRFEQLFREDVRNTENINDISSLELLAIIINNQVGELTNYTNLANKTRVSDQTIRRWMDLLEKHYYCFSIKPWSKNVVRSLIKEPKYYLWDWSQIKDEGARYENFVASHLLKSICYWNETGLGNYNLHYLRDKEKREVDFVITKNDEPWILVEAKYSDRNISPSLRYFHENLKPKFSFQVVYNMDDIKQSCFDKSGIWVVPASTFLSQLV